MWSLSLSYGTKGIAIKRCLFSVCAYRSKTKHLITSGHIFGHTENDVIHGITSVDSGKDICESSRTYVLDKNITCAHPDALFK